MLNVFLLIWASEFILPYSLLNIVIGRVKIVQKKEINILSIQIEPRAIKSGTKNKFMFSISNFYKRPDSIIFATF